MAATQTTTSPRRAWPLVADLACVLALAVGGKDAHDSDDSWWVVLAIVWPLAVAAVLVHLVLVARGRSALRVWPEGALVLAATYGLGMALRAVSGRGLAPGFLVVAALFLTLTMLGWRVVVLLATRRRSVTDASGPSST